MKLLGVAVALFGGFLSGGVGLRLGNTTLVLLAGSQPDRRLLLLA